MKRRPFHNTGKTPVYKGATLIQPGESRDVDEIYLDAVEETAEAPAKLSLVEKVRGLSIKGATAEFGTLTDDELDDLEQLESEQEEPRKGLLSNITVEKLQRAGDAGDAGETGGDTDNKTD